MKILLALLLLVPSVCFSKNPKNNGRFQLKQLGEYRRDQYLLDTQTGRIWTKKCALSSVADKEGSCVHIAWTEDSTIGINTTYEKFIKNAKEYEKTLKK